MQYVNTSPAQLLATHPRAVYRVTLERSGLSALSFATGVLSWPQVVEQTVTAVGMSAYGVPLGYPRPATQDEVAVVEIRAPSAPSSGDSVGDLVRVADDASSFSRVVRIERLPPVPGAGDTKANAERAATREAEASRAAEATASESIVDRIERAAARAGVAGLVVLGIAAVVAVAYLRNSLTVR